MKVFELLRYLLEKGKLTFKYSRHQITKNEFKKNKRDLKEKRILTHCKLGVAYNLFDGEELLEASIKSIRPVANYVVVVWQKVSNFKEPAHPKMESFLLHLKEKGLIDELYLYEPKFDQKDKHYNEKNKRNIGLKLCKKAGCQYFLSMDTDEFYHANQVQDALKYICENKIKSSAVSVVEYLKDPTNEIINGYTFAPSEYQKDYTFYCPFIMKIHRFRKQKHSNQDFPCLVDPSRGLNAYEKFYLFPKHIVALHHMSTTRKDLAKKYQNSNLRRGNKDAVLKKLQNKILAYDYDKNLVQLSSFNGLYIQKVPNVFNIHVSEGEQ